MASRVRRVAVPVIAHRHVPLPALSPRGSAGGVASAVRNGTWTRMAALRPGTVSTVDEAGLADAIAFARATGDSTWHGIHPVPFGRTDAARAYLDWWGALTA